MFVNGIWSSHKFDAKITERLYDEYVLNGFQDGRFGSISEDGKIWDYVTDGESFYVLLTNAQGFVSSFTFSSEDEYEHEKRNSEESFGKFHAAAEKPTAPGVRVPEQVDLLVTTGSKSIRYKRAS